MANKVQRKIIEKNLSKALLENGVMAQALFEYELEEHIAEYRESMRADRDEYFFAITEHTNDVAMLLIEKNGTVHINEKARRLLQKLWRTSYSENIRLLLPDMVAELAKGYLYGAGVKVQK